MKLKRSPFVLFLALLVGCNVVYGQDSLGARPKKPRTPGDYQPRTLLEVANWETGAESRGNKEETMTVHGDILPSRVRATYTGSVRKLPPIKKEVLKQWARLYAGFPEGYTQPYEKEILFIEGGEKYWLAVKKDALPRFKRELRRGGPVDLYLIRVGRAKTSDEWELMLLIESFRKPSDPIGQGL